MTFYPDGVIETQNHSDELFGFERAKAISTTTAAAIADEAVEFGQEDDITVVTIERLPAHDLSGGKSRYQPLYSDGICK